MSIMVKKNFTLSASIENGLSSSNRYIVTPNVKNVLNEIVNAFQIGIHSFTIIGTYGTGKSSFLLNLEKDLKSSTKERVLLKNPNVLSECEFEFLNILGDSKSLSEILTEKLSPLVKKVGEPLNLLNEYYLSLKKKGKQLFIAIDEFGKVLEHAVKYDPESELYFFQKLTEYVNSQSRDILLITTLHQNFSAYASKLNQVQRNEWTKVKGRFQEVVFAEPIEQLLYLAAEHISKEISYNTKPRHLQDLFSLAIDSGFISSGIDYDTMVRLSPLDAFSAYALTMAIQRYGQNERSLFSFLTSNGNQALAKYEAKGRLTYNLAVVYDYILNSFHSYLNDANADSTGWRGIRDSIERVETSKWDDESYQRDAIKLVKAIGLLNLFGNAGFSFSFQDMECYAEKAMDIKCSALILRELQRQKIIRYAEYKRRLILFEGTDINIEQEIINAGLIVPRPVEVVDDLRVYFNNRISAVKASYYHRGTPRYFEYQMLGNAIDMVPTGDVDGYIQMIFPTSEKYIDELKSISLNCESANIYACFTNIDEIIEHLHKIKKYDYIVQKVLVDKTDRVALREMDQLREYEKTILNRVINESMFSYRSNVVWLYKGVVRDIRTQRDFNKLLSIVCDDVYCKTPIINNELFNKHKLSSNISAAKAKYLQALLENSDKPDMGFDADKYPPEKTIYFALLKNTGLHINGEFSDAPSNKEIASLWDASEEFLKSSVDKPRKVSDLIKILSYQPYKIKDGLLDFWIPTYLFIKRQDYALYGGNGQYIPNINSEFFDLLKKHPDEFKVKSYAIDGVKLQFFNQYRKFIGQGEEEAIKGTSFIETIKPFFFFYSKLLNEYAKNTKKIDHKETIRFRDILSKAKDPEKTFFEDLPLALGYESGKGDDFVRDYCSIIQRAVRELRECYNQLIDRIENHLIKSLGLSTNEYPNYVDEIQSRLSMVKEHLLTPRQKEFYQHVMAKFDKRVEWYQSVCYSVLNSPLDRMRDEQEPKLLDDLVFLFRECEKQAVISEGLNYKIDEKEERLSNDLETKIDKILSGNNNLDVYTLTRILQKKIKKND